MLLKGFILLLLLYWSQNGFKLFTHFLLILLSVVQHFSRPCLVFKCALEIKPNLNTAIYQETSCFLLLSRFMEILISFSSRTLAPTHSAKTTSGFRSMILLCLIGQPTCLTWTPSGIYGIFSRKRWETVDPKIEMSWRLNNPSATPQANRFHTSLMLEFVLKESKPSIECIN